MHRFAVSLLLLATVAFSQELKIPPTLKPRPTTRPFVPQELFASYWTLETGWHTELQVRNNLAWKDLTVTPFLRTFQGVEVALDPLTLKPDEIQTIDLHEAVAKHAPNLLHSANAYGSVVFRYSSPDEANVFAGAMVHFPGKPISLHFDAERRFLPGLFDTGSFESIWWLPSGYSEDYLVLTNTGDKAVQTELTYTTKDRILTKQIVVLGPKQVRRVATSEVIRDRKDIGAFGGVSVRIRHGADTLRISHFMVDEPSGTSAMLKVFEHAVPDEPAENTLRAPMIALQTPDPVLGLSQGGTQLTPAVVLRNTTSQPLNIVPALSWKSAADTGSVPLPPLSLAPGETRSFDIAALQGSGTVPKEAQWGSLALSYKGNDNDLIALAVTTDQAGKVVAQTAFTQTLGSIFKGTAWYSDSLRKSLITVGNGGTKPTTASVVLYYNNAQERYELRPKLNPGQQAWIDVAQLIQNQVPDANGKTIPPDVTFGSYELRDPDHIGQGTLFEGKLTIDKTFGNAAYGCVLECCYWDPSVDPTPYSGYVGTGNQDHAWSTCMDDGVNYDITYITNWTSGNLGVAQFNSYVGYFDLVGAGSSGLTVRATIESPYKVPYCKYMTRSGPGTANGNPHIDSITPSQALVGTSVSVSISGSGFTQGMTIVAGPNISVTNLNVVSQSSLTATFTITNSTSSGGSWNISVKKDTFISNSKPFYVQIPTSILLVDSTVLPTGTTGDYGCTPTMNYGIVVDLKYQVLDQRSPAQAISDATMIPHETATLTPLVDHDICPTRISTCTHTTASDGTFHDAPFGGCLNTSFVPQIYSQTVFMIVGGQSYQVRTNNLTLSTSGVGHGSVSNGLDINKSR